MAQPVELTGNIYEAVAASATAQVLGGNGAVGDILEIVSIAPATTSPGNVTVLDGTVTVFTFSGGASSVPSTIPFTVNFGGAASVNGPWKITTGTNVSAFAAGRFTV